MNILVSLIASVCVSSAAFAQSAIPVVSLDPQERIVGQGRFCGVFDNAVVIQNVAAGKILLADATSLRNRVSIDIPLFSGHALRVRQIVDINGDGCSDFLIEDRIGAKFDIWTLRGPTVIQTYKLPIADFFGTRFIESHYAQSGNRDLFFANRSTGELNAFLLNGMSWSTTRLSSLGELPGWNAIGMADWNHDGLSDALVYNPVLGEFGFSKGFGGGLHKPVPFKMEGGLHLGALVGAQDLNNDGRPELMFIDSRVGSSGRVVVLSYDAHLGFISDEGIEKSLNAALKQYVDNLGSGDWKVTVVSDPSGAYASGVVLSVQGGLL